jgi:hypothetical protein
MLLPSCVGSPFSQITRGTNFRRQVSWDLPFEDPLDKSKQSFVDKDIE